MLLSLKKFTCREYDRVEIPCWHALTTADSKGVAYGTIVVECYKTKTWIETYEGEIIPERDSKMKR